MAIKFTQVIDLGNQRVTNVGSPAVGTDATNRDYVDNVIQGLSWKLAARVSSTGDIDLSAPGTTIDGVTLVANNRFLAKDQADATQNGIYVFNGPAVAATRSTDADSNADVVPGMALSVEEGTVGGDKTYLLVTDAPVVLGTTALSFSVLAGGSSTYSAGDGLTLSGSTFAVGAGTGIVVAADTVSVDTNVVVRGFAINVGDGSATSITVTHGLGTYDVNVEVYTNGGARDTVMAEVTRLDVNNVTLGFGIAPAANAYRVAIKG